MDFQRKEVAVKDLVLDPDNPRFRHLRELKGQKKLGEEQMMTQIREDEPYVRLSRAIKEAGVTDPIWVKPIAGGKYLVVEGNRRTTVLLDLISEGVKPPTGVRYDTVQANVLPEDTSETDLLLLRVRLQTGKDPWETFNTAMAIWDLRYKSKLEVEDIATETQKSATKVRAMLDNVKLLNEYSKATKDTDPRQFSYFGEAPKRVRDWLAEAEDNKKQYFELISPMKGPQRIRSVATKGGLREFALLLDQPEVLQKFVKDKGMTVEEAVDIVHEKDILVELPFMRKLGTLALQLSNLSPDQVDRVAKEKKVVIDLKRLKSACENVIAKIDGDDS